MASSLKTKFSELSEGKRMGIVAGVVVGVLAVVSYFIYRDLNELGQYQKVPAILRLKGDKKKNYQQQINDAVAKIKGHQEKIDKIKDKRDEVAAKRELIKTFDELLPSDKDLLGMFQVIEGLVKRASVELVNLTRSEGPSSGQYSTVIFNISLTGEFHNLVRFINLVESAPRFMTLDRAAINRGPKPETQTATLQFSTYTAKAN